MEEEINVKFATTSKADFKTFKEFDKIPYSFGISQTKEKQQFESYTLNFDITYKRYRKWVTNANCILFFTRRGTTIAYAIVVPIDKDMLYIGEFKVNIKLQRKGIGKSCYLLLEKMAIKKGYSVIKLYSNMPGAICFWQKMGFHLQKKSLYEKRI